MREIHCKLPPARPQLEDMCWKLHVICNSATVAPRVSILAVVVLRQVVLRMEVRDVVKVVLVMVAVIAAVTALVGTV